MDLSKIKNFVKQNGDKFVFVENGEPEVVLMSFQEYEKLTMDKVLSGVGGNTAAVNSGNTARKITEAVTSERFDEAVLSTPETGVVSSEEGATTIDWRARVSGEVSNYHPVPARLEDITLEDLPI